MNTFHKLRAWKLKRQDDRLIRRAIAGRHVQSAYQTSAAGSAPQRSEFPSVYANPLFHIAALTIAFAAGYVVADDQRIERDVQQQLSALCAAPWPADPGASAARFRACSGRN